MSKTIAGAVGEELGLRQNPYAPREPLMRSCLCLLNRSCMQAGVCTSSKVRTAEGSDRIHTWARPDSQIAHAWMCFTTRVWGWRVDVAVALPKIKLLLKILGKWPKHPDRSV